jgi:hypothetical protein
VATDSHATGVHRFCTPVHRIAGSGVSDSLPWQEQCFQADSLVQTESNASLFPAGPSLSMCSMP